MFIVLKNRTQKRSQKIYLIPIFSPGLFFCRLLPVVENQLLQAVWNWLRVVAVVLVQYV